MNQLSHGEQNPAIEQWQALREYKSFAGLDDDNIQQILTALFAKRHGHFDDWSQVIASLPQIKGSAISLDESCPRVDGAFNKDERDAFISAFKTLMPWRKGPFQIADVYIDSEWRSDFKYERLQQLPIELSDKHILDVGSGNGYFLYRLLGSGAKLAVGVDPSWHYFAQFLALQRYYVQTRAMYLPMTLDDVLLKDFDITMSMGVLYHRRDPMNYLWQLRETIRSGGYLLLETLIIEGDEQTVLVPQDRYAGMRNVWFLPSVAALARWLSRLGFQLIEKSKIVVTTPDEQRQTPWMDRLSLADFLSNDGSETVEGLPPPKRIILLAQKKP